jgi:hypothetical protein
LKSLEIIDKLITTKLLDKREEDESSGDSKSLKTKLMKCKSEKVFGPLLLHEIKCQTTAFSKQVDNLVTKMTLEQMVNEENTQII